MLSIASAISNNIMLAEVIPSFGYAYWFATPENEWKDVLWKYLPDWLTVNDRDVLKGYYKGDSSLYDIYTLRVWLSPDNRMGHLYLCAGLRHVVYNRCFTTAVDGKRTINLSDNSLALGDGGCKIGFLPQSLDVDRICYSRRYFSYQWSKYFISYVSSDTDNASEHRFLHRQAVGCYGKHIYRILPVYHRYRVSHAVGPIFFLLVIFFLFRNLVKILISVFGLSNIPGIPFFKQQEFGSVLGLCVAAIWVGKRFFTRVLIGVFRRAAAGDSDEPMPYRQAIAGIVVGCIFLVVFSVQIGMSIWPALSFFAIYYAVSVTITRVRGGVGDFLYTRLNIFGFLKICRTPWVRAGLARGDLTGFALYTWFNRAYASHPMPHQLEGFKLADSTSIIRRKQHLSTLIMVAVFFGILGCFWAYLDIYHRYGAMSGFGDWPNAWYACLDLTKH